MNRRVLFLLLLSGVCAWTPLQAQPRDVRLLDAVKRRDEKAFAALLRAKADVNAAQPDGATALAWAVHLGERRMAEALLDAGADADTADEYGETPVTLEQTKQFATQVRGLLKASEQGEGFERSYYEALQREPVGSDAVASGNFIDHGQQREVVAILVRVQHLVARQLHRLGNAAWKQRCQHDQIMLLRQLYELLPAAGDIAGGTVDGDQQIVVARPALFIIVGHVEAI